MKRTVLLAHNNSVISNAFYAILLLNPDYKVIKVCDNGSDTLGAIEDLQPDIAILELQLKPKDGLTIAEQLKLSDISTKIILQSGCTNETVINRSFENGVQGFSNLKSLSVLLECLAAVCSNEFYRDETIYNQGMMATLV